MKRQRLLQLFTLLPLTAGACTAVGSRYERPDVDLPPAIAGAKDSTAKEPAAEWWKAFNDADLNRLVDRALAGNLDVRAAAERVRVARISARAAGSAAEPRLNVNGQYTRNRPSDTQFGGVGGKFSSGGDPEDSLGINAQASWEPDLWGRVARSIEALDADSAALEEDRQAMEVALVADLVEAWLDMSEADAEAAIHKETLELLEHTRSLVKTRVDAGLVTELDLRRTEGDIAIAAARVPGTERRHAIAEHKITLLCGEYPGTAFKVRALSAFPEPPELPVGVPAALLDRRPDLRALERRIESSNARVNVAIADFYPRVSIMGRAGFLTVSPDKLLQWKSRTWSLGPSIDLPILDGGAREFEQLRAEAQRDADTAAWVAAITRAMTEVADGMTDVESTRRIRERLRAAGTAARRTLELSQIRYKEGLTSNLEVLDAERALASVRLDLLRAERDCLSAVVRLSRALGGGWQTPVMNGGPSR